ncbi:MAG: hypothetical protein ABIP01_06780 [Candidatus Limnocylindria bacterium]
MNRSHPRRLGVVLVSLSLAAIGCSAATVSPSGASGGDATTVAVTLQEWAVLPASDSVPAGEVTFTVANEGPVDVHEFVVLRTDLDPADLPTDEHGAVTEAGEGIEVIDEIEDIAVDASGEVTVTLEAGSYILLCNIYDEGEDEAHYTMGMRVAFTATD